MTVEERNKKVEENLKLISYALKLLKVPWNEDYFQQGVLELIRCVENYDDNKGYKFSTYATRCITLKLKDYIKRDFVIKPKLTGEGGGKVYAPPVLSISNTVFEDGDDKPIKGEDIILSTEENWDAIDLRLELERLVEDNILMQFELELFLDTYVNQYPMKKLIKKYGLTRDEINCINLQTKEILKENIAYNYFEGG